MSGEATQPCPFCGYNGHWEGKGAWRVVCTNVTCGAKGPSALYEAQAVIGWNHREPTPSQGLDAATVERCAQVVAELRNPESIVAACARDGDERPAIYNDACDDAIAALRALATDPHQHGGKGA